MRETFSPFGEIASLDLIPALLGLARESRNADVTFRRAGEEIEFLVRGGDLAGIVVPESHSPAQILIRSGKIQADTYRRLTIPEGEDRFSVAVSSGVISRREALWAQKIAAIEALAELLTWTEGSYAVEGPSGSASEEFRLPVERWVLEFFLRSRDRPFIVEKLGPLDTVLVRTERFGEAFSSLGLTADADSVVGLVDGRSSIQDIARKSPSEEFSVLKLLAALLSLGLLRPEWDERPAEAAVPEELPPAPPTEPPTMPEGFSGPSEPAPEFPPEFPPELPPDLAQEVAPQPEIAPAPEINLFALTAPVESPVEAAERAAMEGAEITPLDAPGEPAEEEGRSRLPRWLLAGVLVIAVAGAAVYWRSRGPTPAPGVRRPPPARAPAERASPPDQRVKSPEQPAKLPEQQVNPPEQPIQRTATAAPVPAPAARPSARAPAAPREAAAGESARNWKSLAGRGLRDYQHPGRYRYAIQLEIACEPETLRKAYAHAGDGKEIWIIPYAFHGRACYRVLWGRFTTLEAARKAKSGIPEIFVSGNNRPAVVPLGGS